MVAPLFILLMALLIAGLLLFLFEVQIATRSVRIHVEMLGHESVRAIGQNPLESHRSTPVDQCDLSTKYALDLPKLC